MAARLRIDELVPLYYEALYRYGYRLTGSASDADDLVQETFCTAQTKAHQLRDPDKVRSWLFSILHNAFLLSQRRKRQANSIQWETFEELAAPFTEAPAITEEQLQQALLAIPPDSRAILVLFYFEEFSYKEIAEQLSLPIGTVMSRLARAKQFLKNELAGELDEEEKDAR
jgi:RNA polymerase sigma-70 factor, ECF subfamily